MVKHMRHGRSMLNTLLADLRPLVALRGADLNPVTALGRLQGLAQGRCERAQQDGQNGNPTDQAGVSAWNQHRTRL